MKIVQIQYLVLSVSNFARLLIFIGTLLPTARAWCRNGIRDPPNRPGSFTRNPSWQPAGQAPA